MEAHTALRSDKRGTVEAQTQGCYGGSDKGYSGGK